ncbi:MAG: mechanosensitive ion channel family protein [Bdellovibrionales bacterium]
MNNIGISDQNSNWILLLTLAVGSFAALYPLQKLISQFKSRLASKYGKAQTQAFFELNLERPLVGIILTFIWFSFFSLTEFPSSFEKSVNILLQILQGIFLIQLAYQICDGFGRWLQYRSNGNSSSLDQQLVPFIRKTLKVLVVSLGALSLIQGLGFNVVSILAGLGLGGLALALAAQDTAANVFGSIMILMDKPFKVGDLVRIGDTEGIIEDIGFRSTRIRTAQRSLVSLPNSTVAKEKIENLSARDGLRVRHTLGITYSASIDQIVSFSESIRQDLTLNPLVNKEDIQVSFQNLGDFSLQIVVQFYVKLMTPSEYGLFQQDFLIQVLKLAKKHQVDFAFPTQTLHVESLPKA